MTTGQPFLDALGDVVAHEVCLEDTDEEQVVQWLEQAAEYLQENGWEDSVDNSFGGVNNET